MITKANFNGITMDKVKLASAAVLTLLLSTSVFADRHSNQRDERRERHEREEGMEHHEVMHSGSGQGNSDN